MKNLSMFRCRLFLATLLSGLISSSAVWADWDGKPRSFNKLLKGSYGFAAQGYFDANFDAATQMTTGAVAMRVGVFTFDGKGHCRIESMANKAGLAAAVAQSTEDCTYEINANGTGLLHAVLGGVSFETYFVVVNRGKEFMFTRREGTGNPPEQGGATLVFAIAKKQ
jgi:hypothetical protein